MLQVANYSNYLPASHWGKQAEDICHSFESLFKRLQFLKTSRDTYTTFAFPLNAICLKFKT